MNLLFTFYIGCYQLKLNNTPLLAVMQTVNKQIQAVHLSSTKPRLKFHP